MAVKVSIAVKNAALDARETAIGASPVLKLRTGAPPTNITDADTGTVLATINLPADWMAAAADGSKAKLGTWQDASGDADGEAAHFRLYANDGTTPHMQGTVTVSGGGGDLTLDNVNIATGQSVTITGFTWNEGN